MSQPSKSVASPSSDPDAAELVVLVDETGVAIGTADKATVHTHDTAAASRVLVPRLLDRWPRAAHPARPRQAHLARGVDELLLRPSGARRAAGRGDPAAGARELGLALGGLEPVLPDFRYRAVDASGIVENEICPVFRTTVEVDPEPADDEVAEWAWIHPDDLREAVEAAPFAFSPWLALQLAEWTEFGA